MPFNGSGVYSLPATIYPKSPGQLIKSDDWNELLTELRTALNLTFLRDGQVAATANFDLGVHKIINAALATQPADLARLSQIPTLPTRDAVKEFLADNTGLTDTTTQLKAFYDACIADRTPGWIPAGTYLVKAGVLAFDCNNVETPLPFFFTAGYGSVTFKRADATDAPMLTFSNGTATGPVGNYWIGGGHGGITIDQNGFASASNQHGLSLLGLWGTNFGYVRVLNGGGAVCYIPQKLYGGTNPDPYAVTDVNFEGLEAVACKGKVVDNKNYVGLNGCTFHYLRGTDCEGGGFYGFGAANTVRKVSFATVKGVAFEDGVHVDNLGGSPSRFELFGAELDNVEYGFKINKASLSVITGVRFVHRYDTSVLNPSGGYWPRKCVELASGTLPNCLDLRMDILHRVEAGGSKVDMGSFVDLSGNNNITDVVINQHISDNAGFGFTDGDTWTNIGSTATVTLLRDGYPVLDKQKKQLVVTGATAGDTIANTGYASTSPAVKIPFATEVSDVLGLWSTDTFTVEDPGLYLVQCTLALTLSAAGKRVRIGVMLLRSGTSSLIADSIDYSVGTSVQHYTCSRPVNLLAGDQIWITADQNDAASSALSGPLTVKDDNFLIIRKM